MKTAPPSSYPHSTPSLQIARCDLATGLHNHHLLKDYMTNHKEDSIQTLAGHVTNCPWDRDQISTDERMAKAAEQILGLEFEIKLSDVLFDLSWIAAEYEADLDIGFREYPHDFAAWVDNLLSNLTATKQVRK